MGIVLFLDDLDRIIGQNFYTAMKQRPWVHVIDKLLRVDLDGVVRIKHHTILFPVNNEREVLAPDCLILEITCDEFVFSRLQVNAFRGLYQPNRGEIVTNSTWMLRL